MKSAIDFLMKIHLQYPSRLPLTSISKIYVSSFHLILHHWAPKINLLAAFCESLSALESTSCSPSTDYPKICANLPSPIGKRLFVSSNISRPLINWSYNLVVHLLVPVTAAWIGPMIVTTCNPPLPSTSTWVTGWLLGNWGKRQLSPSQLQRQSTRPCWTPEKKASGYVISNEYAKYL